MPIFSHCDYHGHEQVVFCTDKSSGLRAIIAIHDTTLGPALGGCRMWAYPTDADALKDVLRLSRGMTYKSAISNLQLGGGKSVIIGDPRADKSIELLHAMGDFVESLGGQYITAADSGTNVADISTIAQRTDHIAGIQGSSVRSGDPSPTTAYGVFISLRASVQYRFNRTDLSGLKVAIQGLGKVGFALATYLVEEGAELTVTDIFSDNVERAVNELGATAVAGDDIYKQDVDVFAPCALGSIINNQSISQLKASIIVGAANNQLAEPQHGEILRIRNILYAPDYVVNAGGIIDAFYQRNGGTEQQLKAHVEQIQETLLEIYQRSEKEQRPTNEVADLIAEERLHIRNSVDRK